MEFNPKTTATQKKIGFDIHEIISNRKTDKRQKKTTRKENIARFSCTQKFVRRCIYILPFFRCVTLPLIDHIFTISAILPLLCGWFTVYINFNLCAPRSHTHILPNAPSTHTQYKNCNEHEKFQVKKKIWHDDDEITRSKWRLLVTSGKSTFLFGSFLEWKKRVFTGWNITIPFIASLIELCWIARGMHENWKICHEKYARVNLIQRYKRS